MMFTTRQNLEKFSKNTLCYTTPINYKQSVENLIDNFQNLLFPLLFKEEYNRQKLLMEYIKDCNEKLKEIETILKKKWEK